MPKKASETKFHRSSMPVMMNVYRKSRRAGAGSGRQSPRTLGITSGWRIEDKFFTEERVLVYGSIVVIAYAIGLVLAAQHAWYSGPHGKPCIDFTYMWVTGVFAGSSDPASMYDGAAWAAAWKSLAGLGGGCVLAHSPAGYPPTLLFFTYPLGLMHYWIAFVVWLVATLLFYLATVYAILRRPAAVIAALAPIVVLENVLFGQAAFLTAGLVGLSLLFVERRPWLSGMLLGVLTYKPQFGVLFPLALLASRNWRALASAAATSVALAIAAAAAFGYRGWPSFIASLFDHNASFAQGGVELRHASIYGVLHWAGASTSLSWIVHCGIAIIVALAVWVVWAKPMPHSLKAAILCVGSITATPYLLPYDFCILSIAVAFLVNDGLARGFLLGERTATLICFFSLFLFLGAFAPTGPFVCAIMFFLIARRFMAYRRRGTGTQKEDPSLGSNLIVGTS
jgi:arabinofuranan 3-O-arabinosyltransferase